MQSLIVFFPTVNSFKCRWIFLRPTAIVLPGHCLLCCNLLEGIYSLILDLNVETLKGKLKCGYNHLHTSIQNLPFPYMDHIRTYRIDA